MTIDLADLNVSGLIKQYREVRDALDAKRDEYKIFESNAKDLMGRISMALRDKADELGVDNFKTKEGTAYRNVKTAYRVRDWDEVKKFIQDTGNFQILERRVAKLATAEIHKDTGEIPPGLDFIVEVEFNVRGS